MIGSAVGPLAAGPGFDATRTNAGGAIVLWFGALAWTLRLQSALAAQPAAGSIA